jgi:hypothetical protein
MKTLALLSATVALLAVGGSQALAQPKASHAMRMPMITIVMHDPGCHWFYSGGHYKTSLSVKASMIGLRNYDEAALRIVGSSGVQLVRTGHMVMLGRGNYRITMVGQAPDDNHLKLTVA